MRKSVLPIVLLLGILPSVPSHASGWTARPATYGTVVESDVRVTMSDGVRLDVDVIHPASSGKAAPGQFPVLVTQTPYNKNSTGLNFRDDYMVTRGYVQVIADVRGTGGSEGVWDSFGTREQLDGKEIVDWAANQPWSNGNVGLHGTSYGAINQIFTAAQHPASLRAIFPVVPMSDAYRDITGSGGQVNTSFIPSWLGLVTALGLLPPGYAASDPVGAIVALASHIGGILQFQAATVAKATTGGDTAFDGPFYRQRSPIEVINKVDVPTFIVGGWYDLFQRGEPLLYSHLQENAVPTRLLMGPWYHVEAGGTLLPTSSGPVDLNGLELRWMDHYVQGVSDPALDTDIPPVTYWNLGANKYLTSTQWPPTGTQYEALYLGGHSNAGLTNPSELGTDLCNEITTVACGGTLGWSQADSTSDSMIWQPASGACSRSTSQWTAAGIHQGCEENQRTNDIGGLTYDLPVSGNGINITGPINAHLFVSTTGADAFLTTRLEDVAPDGTATQISAGWNILSMRALDNEKTISKNGMIVRPYHPFTKDSYQPVVGGTVYEIDVEIFGTAAFIAPGHSLRLAIQPSDAPHLSPPVPQLANLAGNVLSLYHDATHPSSIALPLNS